MIWFFCWLVAFSKYGQGASEATDWMKPPGFAGNFWGPVAWHARQTGQLPPLTPNPEMARWRHWGREVLQEGDIVFRLGDARAVRGLVAISRFIARATGSPFSHTGIVAIEDGSPVVYDCSSPGVQRQPFDVWMLDSLGPFGVKRLKPENRGRIPGVIDFCRAAFERQVPFDDSFRMEDDAFYCLELTEKAFRSQRLALSEPIKIGDWEYLASFPLTAFLIPPTSGLILDRPISLEQTVYVPGNLQQGVWASPLLEAVVGPPPNVFRDAIMDEPGHLNLWGDVDMLTVAFFELQRSYSQLPAQWFRDILAQTTSRGPLQGGTAMGQGGNGNLNNEIASRGPTSATP